MIRDIRTSGDPVLRRRAREVSAAELAASDVQRLIDDLIETRRAARGAGLAAPQVGESVRIAVIENEEANPRYPYKPAIPLTVIVNPVIETDEEEVELINEGCLSLPGVRAEVPRSMAVSVRHLDRHGVERVGRFRGLTAGTFQHEVDHLDGVLIVDRAGPDGVMSREEYERGEREGFERRAADIVARFGS